jgi:hypothetical protein
MQRASPATSRRPVRHRARRGHPSVASTPPTVPCPVTSPPASHQALGSIPQASPPRDCSCTLPWVRRFDASTAPRAPRALPRSPHTRTSSRPVRHTTVHGIEPPSRNHPRPGPASFGPTPVSPSLDPTGLNPHPFRPGHLATDTADPIPELSAQRRPGETAHDGESFPTKST